MPLFNDAVALLRRNLEQIRDGYKARLVSIGTLTETQVEAINKHRASKGFPLIESEVVFIGRHVYQNRILKDGYSIDDVICQITHAMESESVVLISGHMTAMENPRLRADGYGNQVNDRVVFECTARHPRPELFSVVPKGDLNKPQKREKAVLLRQPS